uniref:Uncharacterized protein n=1 Tax=Eutreptiella gymnastica TaxID=73025 RepID=A0A7S4CB63_9EUGL|mmetsp:Transcript_69164/g.116206  ORF Transcript_69164/g.116206 Transcript_69164/m.116206 type:complete len:100 (+) Transcript_69164:568-867(+)
MAAGCALRISLGASGVHNGTPGGGIGSSIPAMVWDAPEVVQWRERACHDPNPHMLKLHKTQAHCAVHEKTGAIDLLLTPQCVPPASVQAMGWKNCPKLS